MVTRDQGCGADVCRSGRLGADADPVAVGRSVATYRAAGVLDLDQVSGTNSVDAFSSILVARVLGFSGARPVTGSSSWASLGCAACRTCLA